MALTKRNLASLANLGSGKLKLVTEVDGDIFVRQWEFFISHVLETVLNMNEADQDTFDIDKLKNLLKMNKSMKKFDPSKRKRWNRAIEGFYLSILDRSVLRFRIKHDSFGGYGVWYTPHGTNTESERSMFFKQCVGWLVESSPQIWNNLVRDGERSSLFEVKGKENMWMLGMLSFVNHSCNATLSWNKGTL